MADTISVSSQWLQLVVCFLFPILFIGGCWSILLLSSVFENILPWPVRIEEGKEELALESSSSEAVEGILLNRRKNASPLSQEGVKLIPATRYSAWISGRCAGRLENPSVSESEVILEMAELTGIPVEELTREQVITLGDLIQVADQRPFANAMRPLRNFFTIVNCLWIVAILGLVFTLWPFLNTVAKPLMDWLFLHILTPLYHILLTMWPLWELAVYLACLYITSLSLCFQKGANEWVALSGVALSSATYSYIVDDPKIASHGLLTTWFFTYVTLSLVPLAKKFDSTLLGFVSIGTFFGAFNTWIIPAFVVWIFSGSTNVMAEIWCTSAFVITSLLIFLKVKIEEHWYENFKLGFYIFGPTSFFTSWLFLGSYWFIEESTSLWLWYTVKNLVCMLVLGSSVALARTISFQSLETTSKAFFCIWIFTKVIDLTAIFGDGANIVAAFLTFSTMWLAAWFIKKNPTWAKSLLP